MGDIELQIFSERLKELRASLNLTQAQFVEDLGITASALSAYEKNLKNPSISVAKRIAEKYHVSVDWLCGLSNNKNLGDNFETYSDVANTLLSLDKCTDIVLTNLDGDPFEYTALVFTDKQLDTFIREWREATNVLENTSINKEITRAMYESWKKSKLEELSTKKLKKKRK